MRDLRSISTIAALLLALAPMAVSAQGSVTGSVVDARTGQPLASAQVFVQGSNIGTLTAQNGQFLLTGVPLGERNISAVLIGYDPVTVTVTVTEGVAAEATFELIESAIGLEEVVVTATGEQRRVEIGNALTTVNVDDVIEVAPVSNLANLLQGRSAGVMVGSASGTSGMGSRIRIRGSSSISLSNEPLVYIDGIRMNSDPSDDNFGSDSQDVSRLDDLNPEEIQSIEIVKGPSASTLYGTEAASGVIRITTKRGRSGETSWRLWGEYGGITDESDYPLNYRGLDANAPAPATEDDPDYREACLVRNVLAGDCSQTGVSAYSPLYDPEISPLVTGQRRQYGASVGGGGGGITYFISGELERERGPLGTPGFYHAELQGIGIEIDDDIVNPNRFERRSFRTNVTAQVAENATAGLGIGYTSVKRRWPINDNSSGGLMPSAFFGGAFPDRPDDAWGFLTPAQVLGQDNGQNIQRFMSRATGTFSPLSWLTLRGTGGLDFSSRHDLTHQDPFLGGANDLGNRNASFAELYLYTLDMSGTAERDITETINSRTTLGVQYFEDTSHLVEGDGDDLVPGSESLGTSADRDSDEETNTDKTLGVFLEEVVGINDRLFVTGAVRADDNSAFGRDFNLIWYPKAAVSWVVSQEAFFPQADWLGSLRLRGAWGASGRQPGSTDAITTLSANAIADPDDQIVNGVVLGDAGNLLLRPEKSTEFEAGFDADLFAGRAGLEFTWFKRTTRDIIVEEPLPPSLGSDNDRFQNLGEAETSGFELGLYASVIETDNVVWDLSFSGSLMDSQLNDLGLPGTDYLGEQLRHMPGYPLGSQFDFAYTYEDSNGDGMIAVDEVAVADSGRVFMGAGLPEREFSLSSTLRLGQHVQLYALLDHQGDYIAFNNTEGFRCQFSTCRALQDVNAPLFDQARGVAREYTDVSTEFGYMEDGDFFKLREVSLSLFAPEDWVAPLRSSGVSLTVSVRNLAVWTDYTGVDPEINSSGSSDNFGTSEFLTQGIPRYITARLSVTF